MKHATQPLSSVILILGLISTPGLANTTESATNTAPKTGQSTDSIACPPANCVNLAVSLPATAKIIGEPKCLVNIKQNTIDDLPHGQFNEMTCGKEGAWAMFEKPVITKTATEIRVSSRFHNKSGDRDRDAKLSVEWSDQKR